MFLSLTLALGCPLQRASLAAVVVMDTFTAGYSGSPLVSLLLLCGSRARRYASCPYGGPGYGPPRRCERDRSPARSPRTETHRGAQWLSSLATPPACIIDALLHKLPLPLGSEC
ncbi:hypothetical protein AAFF_G00031880 [Aldrovandia affinis]|uniref:Secreted protein n=1 Tax=Aldrovandia affinis TaxID=143900 RepID=A0AAD7S3T1_9TELE|nr:hypothetical protein AAFF_G00031880 [Aldrovandia affinis]